MRDEIANDLRILSAEMNRVANEMINFSDDDSCLDKITWQTHAREMLGAASMANDWAMNISPDV